MTSIVTTAGWPERGGRCAVDEQGSAAPGQRPGALAEVVVAADEALQLGSLARAEPVRGVAGHGQVIATSQTYKSKESALHGIEPVRNNAPDAPVEDKAADWQSQNGAPHQRRPVLVAGSRRCQRAQPMARG